MAAFKLSEREKNLLIATASFALLFIFNQFLYSPIFDRIATLKSGAREQRLMLKTAEGKIKILNAIERRLGALPEKSELSREEKALAALNLLTRSSAAAGLKINAVRPTLDEREGLRFSLSCAGKYRNLRDFLYLLSQLRILILVDSLDVSGAPGPAPDLNIAMALSVHF